MAPVTLQGPLSEVSRDARAYPVHLLREGDTGLCLFAAAFLGRNDAIHMARNNMVVTCVDTDVDRLREMSALYPDDWEFVTMDAWEFAAWAPESRDHNTYDVVSVDTFTGDATDRSLESLDLWCSLARRVVTCTISPDSMFLAPEGWEHTYMERSDIASWLVLTRA